MQRQVEMALLEEKQISKEKKCIYQFSNKLFQNISAELSKQFFTVR